jgi:hypothetical protein
MKRPLPYLLSLFFAFVICFNANAQQSHKRLKIIQAPWDTTIKASVIPDDIFLLNADGLVMAPRQSKIENQSKFYLTISWPAPSIDGDFVFTVTKKQVILTSGHENPNPNYLFWFIDINEKQYEQIVRSINQSKRLFDEQNLMYFYGRQLEYKNYIPEQKHRNAKDSNYKMYLNAKKLIDIFNKELKPKDQIMFPDRGKLKNIQPIITATMESEITQWYY